MTYDPNLYDLHHGDLHVLYSTTAIDGKPHLRYADAGSEKSFTGEQIQTEELSLGHLVSVVIETVPDLRVVTFSFFVPKLNVTGEAQVTSVGIYTTARTSIGGPALVKGQLATWRTISLSGTARFVKS
jgi:hypothetical protein